MGMLRLDSFGSLSPHEVGGVEFISPIKINRYWSTCVRFMAVTWKYIGAKKREVRLWKQKRLKAR
jgi:hypothetical protein